MSVWEGEGDVTVVDRPVLVAGEADVPFEGDWKWNICEGGANNGDAGTFIATIDPYVMSREMVFDMNRPCSVSGKIAANNSVINATHGDGYPVLSCGDRTLKCYRFESGSWVIRFAGIIWQVSDEGEEDTAYTSFTAFDPWQFLFKRMIRRNDGNLKKTVTLANNAAAAIKRHIDKTIEFAGPCYIDTDDGFFEPALVYLTMQYEQDYLGRAFIEVCETGTVDVIMEPVDRTDGILVSASAVEQRGSDVSGSVSVEYDTGDRTAKQWSRDLDMETAANQITNFNGSKKKFSFQEDTDSQDRFGILEDCRVLTDIEHQDALDALTSQELAERKNPRENVQVVPFPRSTASPFTGFFLGDFISVSCSDQAREAVSGVQRVWGFSLDIDDEGVERVSELRVAPQ
jgi:hypothetical protein